MTHPRTGVSGVLVARWQQPDSGTHPGSPTVVWWLRWVPGCRPVGADMGNLLTDGVSLRAYGDEGTL